MAAPREEFDFIVAARELIAADSVSSNGNLRAVQVLERLISTHWSDSLESYRMEETEALGARHCNLIVYPRGAPPQDNALLLVTHTDTVASGPLELWTETNPWQLKVAPDGDTLFGLGVADVKIDALAKLYALSRAPASARGKVAFCGTFAEEVGCLGAKFFLAHAPFRPAYVACGEPSELRIIDAHKGYFVVRTILTSSSASASSSTSRLPTSLTASISTNNEHHQQQKMSTMRYRLTFYGKAAHSSTPHLGVNAIERALEFCQRPREGLRLAVRKIDGGDLANKVPARCVVEVDVIANGGNFEEELRQEQESSQQQGSNLKIEFESLLSAASSADQSEEGGSCHHLIDLASRIARSIREIIVNLEPREDRRFDPPTAVFNFGVISTTECQGDKKKKKNTVVTFTCDARLLPGHKPDEIFARVQEIAARLAKEEEDQQQDIIGVECICERGNPAMALPEDSFLRKAAMKASSAIGLDPTPMTKPTNTEGGVFVNAGLEALVFGPGRSTGNAHTANERQSLAQVKKAAEWYSALIEQICSSNQESNV